MIDPVHIFSNSNVIGGVFNYSGSSLKTRSTSIRIRYSDPDNLYKPNVICIEDADLISKYGYQVKEVLAFGCTSKTQAQRMGRWMMKSEELDANTVTFAVGLDGALVFPGRSLRFKMSCVLQRGCLDVSAVLRQQRLLRISRSLCLVAPTQR